MSVDKQWKYFINFQVDKTKVSSDQTNFPVLLLWDGNSSTSNLPSDILLQGSPNQAKSDGSDIRFTSDSNGQNELPFEIVKFVTDSSASNARAEIYIKLSAVSSSDNTNFYMWWGNPYATAYGYTDTYGRNNVWSSQYDYVYHLAETSGSTVVDSTGNGYDGTYQSGLPNIVSGGPLIDYQSFLGGSYKGILVNNSTGLTYTTGWNVLFFVANNWDNDWAYLITKDWVNNYRLSRQSNTNTLYYASEPLGQNGGSTNVNDNVFRVIHWNYISTGGGRGVYLNGTRDFGDSVTGSINSNSSLVSIGYNHYDGNSFKGGMAEIRSKGGGRTDAWITTESNSLYSPKTFVISGSITSNAKQSFQVIYIF